ncbi:MAG: acetyl-coenzyme A synthetase N-terminal domain-containing protein, partial [Gammaproteobacteria bacterium]
MLQEGDLLWQPSQARIDRAEITQFMGWLERERGLKFDTYASLWQWSVDDLEAFWGALWHYFEIKTSAPYAKVLSAPVMPGAKWFEGSRLNLAEHVMRRARGGEAAIFFAAEASPLTSISWDELGGQVARVARAL